MKGWKDETASEISKFTDNAVNRSDIRRFLSGKLKNLPITGEQLEKAGVTLSSVRGRTGTIRRTLQRRLSDHNEQRHQRRVVTREAWLTDTLSRIADHKITKFDELMPWRFAEASA